MENNLTENVLAVCSILNKHSVDYMIVGGTAVALHGFFRQSRNVAGIAADKPDLDFWYNPTYQNYFHLLNALEELGIEVSEFKNEQTPEPKRSFFRYEFEKFTLDFLPQIKATIKFRSSFNKREIITLNEIKIPFISYDDLILDKLTNSRLKDKTDVEQLKIKKKK